MVTLWSVEASMTPSEWAEIVEWMVPRFPRMAEFTDEQWAALWDDLHWYQAADVAQAVKRCHESGAYSRDATDRLGGVLLRNLREWKAPRTDYNAPLALPAPSAVSWREVAAADFGDPDMTLVEAVHRMRESRAS